jgi:hypothetical protein
MSGKLQKRVDAYCRRARQAEEEVAMLKSDNFELREIIGTQEQLLNKYRAIVSERQQHG